LLTTEEVRCQRLARDREQVLLILSI